MKLKQIIETVPGNTILKVKKCNEEVMFIGKAANCFSTMPDIELEEEVFTFFPLIDVDGDTFLNVYMDEE